MKRTTHFFAGIFIIVLFTLNGCKKDENPLVPVLDESPESAVQTYNTNTGGTFSTSSGYEITVIPGTVPKNQNGSAGDVTFSIESGVQAPKPIPSNASLKGSIIKFGPESFVFQWPVRIKLKYAEGVDPSSINIIRFNSLLDKWTAVAISGINTDERYFTADVFELGYYALATLSQGLAKINSSDAWGGFIYNHSGTNNYYTLSVASVSNWVYSWQQGWFESEALGATGSTGTSLIPGVPASETYILLPQASYEIWVTRTEGKVDSKFYTYSIPISGSINKKVTYGTIPHGQGWTPLGNLPAGGQWLEGFPPIWPTATATYGTGAFQATLTWINNSLRATDLDLHLFGPNDMHVFWSLPVSNDGSIELDRDWLTQYGQATENIYSVSTMPSGSYRIVLNLYSGDETNYNVRVIRNGAVQSFSGRKEKGDSIEIMTFEVP